jgi:uncharacterized protein YndB with AHSA1/START domain
VVTINEDAPAVARSEVEIEADPETVWGVLSDIDDWPSWNPEIRAADLSGPLQPGSVFHWKAGPASITSTLREVDRPHVLAWTGKSFGMNAIHVYRLEPRDGKTVVRTEESWDGLAARLLRGWSQRTLQTAVETGPEYLKAEAERRALELASPTAG